MSNKTNRFLQENVRKVLVVMLILSLFSFTVFHTNNVNGEIIKNKNVKVKVVSVTKKKIKLKIKNNRSKKLWTSGLFVLKKRVNNKWKKVKYKKDASFCKTIRVEPKGKKTVTIKWKEYFDKNLSKGKYKIEFVKSKTFKIK